VVLQSHHLADWATRSVADLDDRYQENDLFEPEYSIFRATFERLRLAAGAFPGSASIQKNIVLGILEHGLLEDLDAHVLDLWEIARVLNPLLVREVRMGYDQLPDREWASSAPRVLLSIS
jgi:hypothetical protein